MTNPMTEDQVGELSGGSDVRLLPRIDLPRRKDFGVWKPAVVVASTPADFSMFNLDGRELLLDDRVLIKDRVMRQLFASQGVPSYGIYTVTGFNAFGPSYPVFEAAADVLDNAVVPVTAGTLQAGTLWAHLTDGTWVRQTGLTIL